MNLVFIYGPPAAGKLTVARQLSALTGYSLFHNHLSLDCVTPVFAYGTPSLENLVRKIRKLVLDEAAEQQVDLITTFVYVHPLDIDYVQEYLSPYESRNGRLCLVRLDCPAETLLARVGLTSRSEARKLTSPEMLSRYLEQYDFFSSVPGYSSLVLDNTNLSADEAARAIVEHFNLPTTGS